LAALTQFSHLQVWQLMVFAVIEGVIISFDSPAFQALTVRLVPRSDFQQAIALNSTNYHTSRMLGPVVAWWLMALHGPGLVFLFDGITYFVVALVLIRVNLGNSPRIVTKISRGKSLRQGFQYILSNASLRFRLLQLMLTLSCIYPMMVTVFRVYVKQKFNLGPEQFGAVFSFPAMGSMAGALTFAALKPRNPMKAMYIGIPLVFIMLFSLPWIPSLSLTTLAMSLTGFGLYLAFASLTVSMQLEVQEEFRGRLSSVIGMGFSAIGPLMSFPWGHLADNIGSPETIFLAAAIFGIGSAILAFLNQRRTAALLKIAGVS
ncbi:MAG: MFS transporter, partial [Bdellovibrionales bacterium]